MKAFSEEQADRFIEHLTCCHSWYKHISLLTGSEFIIVVDPDAGRNYSELHPKLPFGNTKEGYQRAFGFLNYYCGANDQYSSDCQDSLETAGDEVFSFEEITQRYPLHQVIHLFPYVGWEFTDVFFCWSDALDRIVQGYEHENGADLIRLGYAILRCERYWQEEISEETRQRVWQLDGLPDAKQLEKDNRLTTHQKKCYKKYYKLFNMVQSIHEKLRGGEVDKIRLAVAKLQTALEE